MSQIKICDKLGCDNQFDIDAEEGVVVTSLNGHELKQSFFCCNLHKKETIGQ